MVTFKKEKSKMGKIISVVNQKGGVGKTTTALNLASILALKKDKRVLLIDLDPQGNATSGLGIEKQSLDKSVFDVLMGEKLKNVIIKPRNIKNLDILPANNDLSAAEVNLVNVEKRGLVLKKSLNTIIDDYDYIIIDCPPSLGLLFINALSASRYALITVQTEFYAMEGLGSLVGTIQKVQKSLNPSLSILGVLLTMYDTRTSLSEQVKLEIAKVFNNLVFDTNIPRNIKLAEAPSYGLPIIMYDKWSKGSKAYKQLTKEVIDRAEK